MKKILIRNTFTKTAIIGALLAISACSNAPRTVSASLALVTPSMEKPNKKILPLQYWALLADTSQSTLPHQRYQIQLNELYISALGDRCRELIVKGDNAKVSKRIACENYFINENDQADKGWFLENEIIDTHYSVEL